MKIGTFRTGQKWLVGQVDEESGTVTPFELDQDQASRGVLSLIGRDVLPQAGTPVPLSELELCAPIPRPERNIFCVGKNYFEHAHEFSASGFDSSAAKGAVPEFPIVFSKVPESVIAHGEQIVLDPKVSDAVDYEAELAVIIGTRCRRLAQARHARLPAETSLRSSVQALASRATRGRRSSSLTKICPSR